MVWDILNSGASAGTFVVKLQELAQSAMRLGTKTSRPPLSSARSSPWSGRENIQESMTLDESLSGRLDGLEGASLSVGVGAMDPASTYMPMALRWMLVDDHKAKMEEMNLQSMALSVEIRGLENVISLSRQECEAQQRELDVGEAERQHLQDQLNMHMQESRESREVIVQLRDECSALASQKAELDAKCTRLLETLSQANSVIRGEIGRAHV